MNLKDIANGTIDYPLATVQADESVTREIQSRLLAWGYKPGPADGDWGAVTTTAYRGFCSEFGYGPNVVSPVAAAQLLSFAFRSLSAIANQTSTFPIANLRANPLIAKAMQQQLTKLGYKPGPIDGQWGSATQSAYAAFAKDNQATADRLTPKAAKLLLAAKTPVTPPAVTPPAVTPPAVTPPVVTPPVVTPPVVTPPPSPVVVPPPPVIIAPPVPPVVPPVSPVVIAPPPPVVITPVPPVVITPVPPAVPPPSIPIVVPPPSGLAEEVPSAGPLPRNLTEIRRGKPTWPIARILSSTDLVTEIQQSLAAMGEYAGVIDGLWGGQSQQAYDRLCAAYGEPSVTLSPRVAKLLLEPEVPNVRTLVSPPKLTDADYQATAKMIGCDKATIRAVVEVEAAGAGFFGDGRPKILFEAHWFSAFTDSRYDYSHPGISSPVWNRSLYITGVGEWDRLYQAIGRDRAGALKSASWGLGQVMGFNHVAAGYDNVETFVRDMHESEGKQLTAMFKFIINNNLGGYLVARDWAGFALRYNGEGFRVNEYDRRLAEAYSAWANVA
jgi:peptidoglycan hydrolase-like protein with peptidoglycan-binding domain